MNRGKEQGMSLIELLVAVVILLIGIIPMMRVFVYELYTVNRANKMVIATNLARDMAEEIRSRHFCEELADPQSTAYQNVFPWTNSMTLPGIRQSFGLEETYTSNGGGNGGRIAAFDDVDDYDGWCRGIDCGTGYQPLETFDGRRYNGSAGYPDYNRFTRRVRVRNVYASPDQEYWADPFASTGATSSSVMRIKRFNFENWTSKRCADDTRVAVDCGATAAIDGTGYTRLKIIEVIVEFDSGSVKDLEVKDVSLAVLPEKLPFAMQQ